MGYPKACNICNEKRINADKLELSVKAFQKGKGPKVMLIGLNPTLAKREANYVLELENEKSSIRKFIVNEVLHPAGLKLEEHVYATNLVKCSFPKNQEPRIICKGIYGNADNQTVKKFLFPFFRECKRYFVEEVKEIKPKIMIVFGEVPHQLLVEEKKWGLQKQNVEPAMKNAFGKKYDINLFGLDVSYFPCIRQKGEAHAYLKGKLPDFQKNLKKTVSSLRIIKRGGE